MPSRKDIIRLIDCGERGFRDALRRHALFFVPAIDVRPQIISMNEDCIFAMKLCDDGFPYEMRQIRDMKQTTHYSLPITMLDRWVYSYRAVAKYMPNLPKEIHR